MALLQGIVPEFFFQYKPFCEDYEAIERTRRCFVEVNERWKQLQNDSDNKERRVQLVQDFCQHYDVALTHISCWIDDFQLEIVSSQRELDIAKAVQNIEVQISGGERIFMTCLTVLIKYWSITDG